MSTKASLERVIEAMERSQGQPPIEGSTLLESIVNGWVLALRAVADAADEPKKSKASSDWEQIRANIEKDRQAIAAKRAKMQESMEEKLVEVVGLPDAEGVQDTIMVPASVRVGDKTVVNGCVLQYRQDGKAHYCPEMTRKHREELERSKAADGEVE